MTKKHQKKSASTKKRRKRKRGKGSGSTDLQAPTGGAMGKMVGGFRRAVGVRTKKKRTWTDYTWTMLLLAAAVGIIAWRFL